MKLPLVVYYKVDHQTRAEADNTRESSAQRPLNWRHSCKVIPTYLKRGVCQTCYPYIILSTNRRELNIKS
ncbi:MAG: hypothetical protein ACXAEU_10440 [Candidatus Hodarchaeales archaeon]